jgi:hypothetical protein
MADNNSTEIVTIDVSPDVKVRRAITNKHLYVSNRKTPKAYWKKKMGLDYVEYSVMRDIADKEYPGWSWTIINTENLGSEAYVVHGRLKWFDEGIWRLGDMVAAHRIQKKRGIDEFVDIGNDIKASNTDCIKKAFNMYLNICDDVYRNQVEDFELSDEQKDEIVETAALAGEEKLQQITELIKDQVIHNGNYKSSLAKLKREAK